MDTHAIPGVIAEEAIKWGALFALSLAWACCRRLRQKAEALAPEERTWRHRPLVGSHQKLRESVVSRANGTARTPRLTDTAPR